MNFLKEIYNKNFCQNLMIVFLILYIAYLNPNMSRDLKNIFNNTIFKMILLFFIVYTSHSNLYLALLLTLAFVLTLDCIHVSDTKEAFKTLEKFTTPMSIQTAGIGQNCNISTICNPGRCNYSLKKCVEVRRR
jgi:hypothetical protein